VDRDLGEAVELVLKGQSVEGDGIEGCGRAHIDKGRLWRSRPQVSLRMRTYQGSKNIRSLDGRCGVFWQ
jgi:hypothetical protein